MKSFKIMVSATALLAALTGCGDDSSKVVAVIDHEGNVATDSSSSKGNTKSSSSVAKDSGTEIDDTYSSSSQSDVETDEDYEHGYVGYISDRSIDPIVGGVVRTWKPTENGLVMVSVDSIDKEGKVKLNTSLEGFNLVEMQKDDLKSMRWLFFREGMESGIYVAKEGVTVTGIISEKGEAVAGAKLKILDKESTTNSSGEFEFEGLPDGVHFMTVEHNGESRVYQVQTTRTVRFTEEQIVNRINWDYGVYTLLTGYEDWSSGRTVVGNTFGLVGPTYFFTDSSQGGNSRFKGNVEFAHAEKFKQDDQMGVYMYFSADIDEEFENHFALTGFILGEDDRELGDDNYAYFDISEASGLSFDAKGTGKLVVQLVVHNSDGSTDYVTPAGIELTEEWSVYNLPFDELRSKLTAVEAINFALTEDGELYLDNVRLDGIVPTKWPLLGKRL